MVFGNNFFLWNPKVVDELINSTLEAVVALICFQNLTAKGYDVLFYVGVMHTSINWIREYG